MKLVSIDKCEIDIVECDYGYHIGLDVTYLDQVGDFIAKCPACNKMIKTEDIYKGVNHE